MSDDRAPGVDVLRRDSETVTFETGRGWTVEDDGSLTVWGASNVGEVGVVAPGEWVQASHSRPVTGETPDQQGGITGSLDDAGEAARSERKRMHLAQMRVVRGAAGRPPVSEEGYLADLLRVLEVPDPDFVAARLVRDGGVKAP